MRTVLALGGLLASLYGAGPAAAADTSAGIVRDAVVTVHQPDPDGCPLVGATISLEPAARSTSIDCAERIGDVLAATGRPQVTLPPTDAGPSMTTVDGGSPTVPALLVLGGIAIVVPLRTRSPKTRQRRRR